MKFFKKLFLLVPLLFAVASCSGPKSPAGTYSFQLGSDKGTHAGIHLLLTEDAVEVEDQEDAKRFELTFDLGASASGGIFGVVTHLDKLIEFVNNHTEADIPSSIEDLIKRVTDGEEPSEDPESEFKLTGYYYIANDVTNAEGRKENRLMMGFDIPFFSGVNIPADIVEMVMYAVYTEDNINIIIPVSLEDLLFQLYWYGYRIDDLRAPVDLHEENPLLKHNPIGSHPIEDDEQNIHNVKDIQDYQKNRERLHDEGKLDDYGTLEFLYNSYHDYHTLTMGLAKNG